MRSSQNQIRTFICLELPKDIQKTIDNGLTEPLRKTSARCSFVKPGNLHLTLKFLGDIDPSEIDHISGEILESIRGYPPFKLSLSKVGSFGGHTPRVVWAGLDGEIMRLGEVASNIDKALAKLGFKKEKRAFKPHLTVARVRDNQRSDELLRIIREVGSLTGDFTADKIIFMKSKLSSGGSIYEPLAEFPLLA
ncbi:RNA 2',3'-cyclic phosphodiesterase [bacterium]|nr:RNA 2',3'-cyclic phosphodiesterase [bacterium]